MALLTISTGVYAQESKESEVPKKFNTYNYRRAMECLDESEYDKAKEFLETEVKENPKNGYAFNILSLLNFINEENDEALEAINKAITLIPKKDAEKLAECYDIRAHIYLQMEDSLKALDDLAFAFKLNPKDTEFIQNRAQIYYEMEQYDLSDAEYQKCIDLDPKDVMGYMGIGRNANAQERWEDAIKMFDKVEKIADEDYNKHFDFRADSYMGLKKWDKAAEDLITFVEKDEEYSAVLYAIEDHSEMIPVLKTKLKLKTMQNPTNPYWPYFLAKVEQKTGDYKAAIEHYYKSDEIDETNGSIGNIIDCCEEMGDYQRALDIINKTLEEDSTLTDLIDTKINVLENLGRYDEAVELAETLFEEGDGDSYNFVNFITRGYAYYKAGNLKGALDDFILAIADYDKYSSAYFYKARIYERLGDEAMAKMDYAKVVELEEESESYRCIPYAYLSLGEKEKAVEYMEKRLEEEEDKGNLYDAACLYSLMGEKEKALDYLERSFQKGWRSFVHMDNDSDLDNIRDTQRYKDLVAKYKAMLEKELSENNVVGKPANTGTGQVSEVPFTKEGGVCKVKCDINGLPLHFVFDTGAADVSISQVEATFMLKNGYLSSNDVVGKQRYIDANGDVTEGTVINIKKVNFGGMHLSNVKASVVRNQKAPLLLGQSVLSKLGKIEIDNTKKVLRITH